MRSIPQLPWKKPICASSRAAKPPHAGTDERCCEAEAREIIFAVKKWQSCKDSNLNKVNQNHLCYRYTTGLRIFYFVVLSNITAFRNKASSNFNFFQTFIPAETESRAGFCRKYRKKGCKNSFPASL